MLVVAVAAASAASAGSKCATSAEVTAIQAAAVQQQLMVAALTCNTVTDFNAFQTGFSTELRRSDRRLLSMFRRLYGARRGRAEYHAFKTRLANDSSVRSIHDNAAYCREARLVFAAALRPDRPTLANFVSGVAVHEESPVNSCEIRVATGLPGMKAAPDVVPRPNPMRVAAVRPAMAAGGQADPAPQPAPAAAPAPQAQTAAAHNSSQQSSNNQKKDSGWFSGLFD